MSYLLPDEGRNALAEYLADRPFREVAALMGMLSGLQMVPEDQKAATPSVRGRRQRRGLASVPAPATEGPREGAG